MKIWSFKLIGQSVFELKSGNQNISEECTPKMGKQSDSNFKSNQALVVSYHPVKLHIDQSVFKLESGNGISRWWPSFFNLHQF